MNTSLHPETAAEALQQWDDGKSLFTIELGGLGPGYEQAIHVLAFEIIRDALKTALPTTDKEWEKIWDDWGNEAVKRSNKYGYSGAQLDAAKNFAFKVLKYGWRHMMKKCPKDRSIQVSRAFPKPSSK